MSGVKKKRWKGPLPVSAIQTVLLKDNRFAEMLLEDRLKQIRIDRGRAKNLLDWQQQSFLLNQAIKETELREMGVNHTSFLPELTMKVTEPAVRARRPFGKVRRSASKMIEELPALHGKRCSLPVLATRRSLALTEFSVSAPTPGQRGHDLSDKLEEGFARSMSDLHISKNREGRESFTHLHGINLHMARRSKTEIGEEMRWPRREESFGGNMRLRGCNLPLYGPEAEAEREEKEKRHVRRLQEKMRELKIDRDKRFLRLEKSLIRDYSEAIETVRLDNERRSDTSKLDADETMVKPKTNDFIKDDDGSDVGADDGSEIDDGERLEGPRSSNHNQSRLSAKSTLDLTHAHAQGRVLFH